MNASDTNSVIEAVWKIEAAKLIAGLARIVRDVGLAEDFAQEALMAALQRWPESGIPGNPGAWLMAAAKNRAMDHFRRDRLLERKHEELSREMQVRELAVPDFDTAIDDEIDDDLLRLIFTACHPVISSEARVALTLRMLGGLTTQEIARAFLVAEPTIAQRIVRAKRTLTEARVPFASRVVGIVQRDCRPFWKSSISSSMKAIPRPPARIGCVLHFAKRRSG